MQEYRAAAREYYNDRHRDHEFSVGERTWIVVKTPFRSDVTGPAEIVRKIGDHLYEVRYRDELRTISLQQMVPYIDEPSIDRSGIPFASSDQPEDGLSALLLKDPRLLEENDLVLVQRGVASDIYEYDIARVVSNNPESQLIRCELLITSEQRERRNSWRGTGLEFNFNYRSILANGFKLTQNQQIRKSTIRLWSQFGIVI